MNYLIYFTPFSSVSIVDFEQVNVMLAGLPLHAFTYFVHLAHFIVSVIRSTFTLTSLYSLFYSKCYGLRGRFLPTETFFTLYFYL